MFIATPAYREPSDATKRTAEGIYANHGGVWRIVAGCPWVGNARSELAGNFLDSGESHILWLDADVAFAPEVVYRMRSLDLPLVTCAYPKRLRPTEFAARRIDGARPRFHNDRRVIALESDGLGCCLVQRHVIAVLDANASWRHRYVNEAGKHHSHIFAHDTQLLDGVRRLDGEDNAFFHRARSLGFGVECLIDETIFHDGHPGNLGETLDAEMAAAGEKLISFRTQGENDAPLNA
jgi:hypothetical protein